MRISLFTAGALTLAGLPVLLGPTAPATALEPVDPVPARAGAAWLTGQLDNGLLSYETQFGPFTDYGLSIDAALALDAVDARGADAAVDSVSDAVAAGIDGYISGGSFGDPGSTYAGPTAKALVLATVSGADPRAFGGVDLVARLEGVVDTEGATAGRIADVSGFGDFANTFGQAFAAQGLDAVGSPLADSVTDFLLLQQCSEGFFRESFAEPDAPQQDCDADAEAAPSVDATAIAVLALSSRSDDVDVLAAITAAVTWLESQQRADGGIAGSQSPTGADANSTGLAGWALGSAGREDAAQAAADFVRRLQTCVERGAIAYDAVALADGAITRETRGQYLRATAQGLPALLWASEQPEADVIGGAGYFKAGQRTTLGVGGAAPGVAVCATLRGKVVSRVTNGDGEAVLKVALPEGTARRTVVVTDGSSRLGQVTFRALGDLRVPFSRDRRVVAGDRQVVKVRGLEPGEVVSIVVDNRSVDFGQADARGRFTGRFAVTGKPRTERVKVVGEFANRKNVKSFRVLAG